MINIPFTVDGNLTDNVFFIQNNDSLSEHLRFVDIRLQLGGFKSSVKLYLIIFESMMALNVTKTVVHDQRVYASGTCDKKTPRRLSQVSNKEPELLLLKGDLSCKMHFLMSSLHQHVSPCVPVCPRCVPGVSPVCPRCVRRLTKCQEINPSLFSSVSTSLKTGEQRSWSRFAASWRHY